MCDCLTDSVCVRPQWRVHQTKWGLETNKVCYVSVCLQAAGKKISVFTTDRLVYCVYCVSAEGCTVGSIYCISKIQ